MASFVSSYIPTTDSAVTRAADVASISGSNFSSWFDPAQSTALVEFNKPYVGAFSTFGSVFNVNDGTPTNRTAFVHRLGGNSDVYSFSNVNGSNTLNFYASDVNNAGLYKYALAIATDSARTAADGSLLGSVDDTSTSISSLVNQAVIQAVDVIHIRRLVYWSQRLPNETLQGITQE